MTAHTHHKHTTKRHHLRAVVSPSDAGSESLIEALNITVMMELERREHERKQRQRSLRLVDHLVAISNAQRQAAGNGRLTARDMRDLGFGDISDRAEAA